MTAPSHSDAVVRAASEVVGGPWGNHAADSTTGSPASGRGSRLWGPAPLLALAAVVPVALAALTRAHCRETGWATPDQYVHACYSDVPLLLGGPGGAAGQPPTTAVLLRLLDLATTTPLAAFDLSVLLAGLCLSVAAVLLVLARTGVRGASGWEAALVALSPVVVTAGVISVDLAAVALLAGALLALRREHPAVAGALVGLAAGVRPAAALVVVALWLVVLIGRGLGDHPGARAGARRHAAGPGGLDALGAAAATAAAVLAGGLVTLAASIGVGEQEGGSRWWDGGGGAGYGALWLLPGLPGKLPDGTELPWSALPADAVTALAAMGLVVVLLLAAAAAARTAGAEPLRRTAAVALVLVAGGLAVSPSVPVQATLVVLPLAAVAAPRWSHHLPWALTECAYATGTWLYLYALSSSDGRGLSPGAYAVLLAVRLAALGWLTVQGVRSTARSVSVAQDDDVEGGVQRIDGVRAAAAQPVD
ncbi:glycosyltransferase 87 family protein [Quadrisphaera granulorum]|uniref:glycosyltransferase 87 family protein n=1 Tax=Quadrisphaera granulorum TaxID=317664 RepID=UPI0014758CD6|nr:glycosyltransferase 87 family protein [Quadrisphaera granulorum]